MINFMCLLEHVITRRFRARNNMCKRDLKQIVSRITFERLLVLSDSITQPYFRLAMFTPQVFFCLKPPEVTTQGLFPAKLIQMVVRGRQMDWTILTVWTDDEKEKGRRGHQNVFKSNHLCKQTRQATSGKLHDYRSRASQKLKKKFNDVTQSSLGL